MYWISIYKLLMNCYRLTVDKWSYFFWILSVISSQQLLNHVNKYTNTNPIHSIWVCITFIIVYHTRVRLRCVFLIKRTLLCWSMRSTLQEMNWINYDLISWGICLYKFTWICFYVCFICDTKSLFIWICSCQHWLVVMIFFQFACYVTCICWNCCQLKPILHSI